MTFTRLTLGEPRLRGRVRGGTVAQPCEEPLVYGANIAPGGGVESEPSGFNNQVPGIRFYADDPIQYSDGSTPDGQVSFIHNNWELDPSVYPVVSTANPRLGTHHIRASWEFAVWELMWGPIRQRCIVPDPPFADDLGEIWHSMYSARVEPGDLVDFGVYALFEGTQSEPTHLTVFYQFYGFDGEPVGFGGDSSNLTDTYAPVSASTAAPASAHYLLTYLELGGIEENNGNWDLDDFWLEVQP